MSEPDGLVRVRLTGRGGQGIMLAGAILAVSAMNEGKHVVQTQEYGPEARLGATKTELVISPRPIAFPLVTEPDILLCLSRDAFLRYGRLVAPGGERLVDESLEGELGDEGDDLVGPREPQGVKPARPHTVYLPFRARARELGNELFTNIIALGALVVETGVVGRESLAKAVEERVKPEYREANARAMAEGFRLGAAR